MTEAGDISPTAYLAEAGEQIRVMIKMIESSAPCLDVIRAGRSAKRALSQAGFALLLSHLRQCLNKAANCVDAGCRAGSIEEVSRVFAAFHRLLCPECRDEWEARPAPTSVRPKTG